MDFNNDNPITIRCQSYYDDLVQDFNNSSFFSKLDLFNKSPKENGEMANEEMNKFDLVVKYYYKKVKLSTTN